VLADHLGPQVYLASTGSATAHRQSTRKKAQKGTHHVEGLILGENTTFHDDGSLVEIYLCFLPLDAL